MMNMEICRNNIKAVSLILCLLLSSPLFAQQSEKPMKRVNTGSHELEYEVRGAGEPVLLIHGAGVAAAFLPLMTEPSLSDYQLIRYHRRGFAGSSPQTMPSSFNEQAADAVALLTHLGIEKAHIVGHSYGGAIALQLSHDYPQFVHSLTVLEPVVTDSDAPPVTPAPEVSAAFALYSEGKDDGSGVIDAFFSWAFADEWPEGTERGVPGGPAQARRDAKNQLEFERASRSWKFGKEEAAKISQPTLLIIGSMTSPDVLASSDKILKRWIPQLENYTVEGVNHSLQMQDPKAVAEPISDFLDRHPFKNELQSNIEIKKTDTGKTENGNIEEFHVKVSGNGEAVLLIHGGFIQDAMLPIFQEPSLKNQKLILYHRRGYGNSAKYQGAYSIESEAKDALNVLNKLDIKTAHIVGYSAGGAVATQLAILAPEKVKSLVLLEPALYSAVAENAVTPPYVVAALQLYKDGKRTEAIEAFESAVAGPEWRTDAENTFPIIVDQVEASADHVFEREVPGVEAYRLPKEKAQRIKQPALIVLSQEFGPFASYLESIEEWLPQTNVVTIPDAGHDLPWKQPKLIAEEISRFISK